MHAAVAIVPSDGGLTTKNVILNMIETARAMSEEPGTFWVNQLENHDNIAGYYPLGEEIWRQTNGNVGAFVHGAGAAASSLGVATVLKRYNQRIRNVVVEPAESPVLSGGPAGAHQIEGIGIGRTPPLWEPALVDDILAVSTADAKEMARRLAREEGLFAGTSSGANIVAAIRVAEPLGARRTRGPDCGAPDWKSRGLAAHCDGRRICRPMSPRPSKPRPAAARMCLW